MPVPHAKIEQKVVRYGQAEAARVVAGMLEKSGDYMLAMHEKLHPSQPVANPKKVDLAGYYSIRATLKKGLRLELAFPWAVRLKAMVLSSWAGTTSRLAAIT